MATRMSRKFLQSMRRLSLGRAAILSPNPRLNPFLSTRNTMDGINLQPVAHRFTASARDPEMDRENHENPGGGKRKMGVFLTGAAVGSVAAAAVSAWSYGEIRRRSTLEKSGNINRGFDSGEKFPLLHAALKMNDDDVPSLKGDGPKILSRRQRFNFITEVVEETACALVFIEIKDLGVRDYFTGEPTSSSNGSGFIVKEDGLILTNAHVVINKPRASVQVRLQDGRNYTGVVEDVDVRSDLATVRIPAKNLPVMKLGQSSDVKPGEFVIAMGSPLSLSNTITTGVVSSVRDQKEIGIRGRDVPDYLQTDAAITFGNSGGPLINLDGEAIGINCMKVTPGISFAIPIDYAKEFLQKSEEARKAGMLSSTRRKSSQRRYIGITMLTINDQVIEELRAKLQIPVSISHGILVFRIVHGSPADNAGVMPGDIVTHINGVEVHATRDVYKMLEGTENLKLTIVRKSRVIKLEVIPEL